MARDSLYVSTKIHNTQKGYPETGILLFLLTTGHFLE